MESIPGFVYCGREGSGYPRSPLHNPFKVGEHGTQEECVALFRLYILQRIEWGHRAILDALDALTEDSVLGCWCKPDEPCHCDVIIEVWKQRRGSDA